MKRRKLGAGPRKKIDTSDEEEIAKHIEDKTSAHGRRHDTVLYTGHTVRCRDLLNIGNYVRRKKGKEPIKSATTVLNKGKPKNIRSLQADKQADNELGLFCCKKPPKTAIEDNELTHHQRAFKRNVLLSKVTKSDMVKTYTMYRAADDKAYLRPGTSIGATGAKAQKVLQSTAHERKLPQHDFGESRLYVTPSSHRFIDKKVVNDNGDVTLVSEKDQSIVFARPKAQITSTGSTWSNEEMFIRHQEPDLYEVAQDEYSISKEFLSFTSSVKDKATHFLDSTTTEDLLSVTQSENCSFKLYEEKRLQNLTNYLSLAMDTKTSKLNRMNENEQHESEVLSLKVDCIINEAAKVQQDLKHGMIGETFVIKYDTLSNMLKDIIARIISLKLPVVRPNAFDLTDGGPGVSFTNHEVKYRSAEGFCIHNLDCYIRSHMATEDQGRNESECINAAIGNALCDGAPLPWDFYQAFPDGINGKDIALDEYKKTVEETTDKNAWKVCEEVVHRVDDAPGPGHKDYMKAFQTPHTEESFFGDKTYLLEYIHKPKTQRHTAPGQGYFKKLDQFIESHMEVGELYIEIIKECCKEQADEVCQYCLDNGWVGPKCQRVPKPIPDYEKLPAHHYRNVTETPSDDRYPDDYQPRAQMKTQFSTDNLSTNDAESICAFSEKYIISEELVRKYVHHLETLKIQKQKRKTKRAQVTLQKQNKTYHYYKWKTLYSDGTLKKLYGGELDKYLRHHNMQDKCNLTKAAKLSWVEAHIGKTLFDGLIKSDDSDDEGVAESSASSEGSDRDDVIAIVNPTEREETDGDMTEVEGTKSRRGRTRKSTFATVYADFI